MVLVKDEFFRKLEPMLSSSSQPEESSSYESDVVTTLLSKLKAPTVSNFKFS